MGRKINTQVTSDDRRPVNHFASHPQGLKIVLVRPRIPQNTGSIARMCAATGCSLDLVAPFFKIDDNKLKRAGLDYWPYLDVFTFDSIEAWLEARKPQNFWLAEVGAPRSYSNVSYSRGDYLIFGDEQEGIPLEWLEKWKEKHISIPQKAVRSLNLATSVGIVTYEALRQLNCYSLEPSHEA